MLRYTKKKFYKYILYNNFICQTHIQAKERKFGYPRLIVDHPYIKLWDNGCLFVKYGYTWDGPSGAAIDTENFMEESLVHDVFYQIIREKLLIKNIGYSYDDLKNMADKELYYIICRNGMNTIRALWVYNFVKFFGYLALRPYIQEIETKIV